MSRLMLIRRGEGASGEFEELCLGEASSPLQAVTMTAGLSAIVHCYEISGYLLIKTARPIAGTAVLKIRSMVVIPSIIVTLVWRGISICCLHQKGLLTAVQMINPTITSKMDLLLEDVALPSRA